MFILYVVFWVILAGFVYTQLIRPILRETPLFPLFRKGTEVKGEIIKTKEELRVVELEKERDQLKKQVDKRRRASK